MSILVLNAGSSSLKFALFDAPTGSFKAPKITGEPGASATGVTQVSPVADAPGSPVILGAVTELADGVIQWTGSGHQATLTLSPRKGSPAQEKQLEILDYVSTVQHALRLLAGAGLSADQLNIAAVGHRVVHGGAKLRQSVHRRKCQKADRRTHRTGTPAQSACA